MKNRALATLISGALMAAPLTVMADPGQFFITPFAGMQEFDGDRHAGTTGVWGVGGEYQFSEHFGTELDYSHTLDKMEVGQPTDTVSYERASLDGIYYLGNRMMGVYQPYLKLGAGHNKYEYHAGRSDQNTDIDAGLGLRIALGERASLRFEAKAIHEVDDSQTHGLYTLGIGYAFGGAAKAAPVAAAVVPPPPPPPAQCPDADHDGVCDAVDQCPNTAPGKRVGSMGCDCDYSFTTHFAFNSAVLNDEDKVELDRLATILVNPNMHFVTGEVYGFTDSVGKPAYNQKLSERRAQSVADYLESKGVAAGSKFHVQGFGAEEPIADNKTEEGRAQNRRVVIRRTDCPAK